MEKKLRNFIRTILQWVGLVTLLGAFFNRSGFEVLTIHESLSLFIFICCFVALLFIEFFVDEDVISNN